ncbi:alcohol dehydrogenase catalytic domain-containing protein [Sphingopyxis sp.]|uniref:alcohol dehydrogenase catalytic domain-containing protein n=1 Tax=Sphingopyxis sp. TaxID=1908224 RepID=UPI002B49388E|nr:alcohol dehydrogenase catalytic domain-containing protein [Sphingopyxis sp.]HJS09768.1 alcohol dehydrogenase catalytic domain-containing protein [Sphingopyxis sp.]
MSQIEPERRDFRDSKTRVPAMRAARLHDRLQPLRIDSVERPSPRPNDVLVEIHACGVVPNVLNVLNYSDDFIAVQPPKPAIFGLDVGGIVVKKGDLVHGFEIGDRVYVNPARYCGTCHHCRRDHPFACDSYTLNGYFGLAPKSAQMFRDYPYGGYAEYMTAPGYSLVRLADGIDFSLAARWGYLGTAYAALQRAHFTPFDTLLINGVSGTLGIGGVLFGLAMGATRILGAGRDPDLLARVKAIAPDRIEVFSTNEDTPLAQWVFSRTGGYGADVVLDALAPEASIEAFEAGIDSLAKYGRHVNCGGILQRASFDTPRVMVSSQSILGSNWFTSAQAREMMELAQAGRVDLSIFDHHGFALDDINEALAAVERRAGGFSNYFVTPQSGVGA